MNYRKKEGGILLIKAKPNRINCSEEEQKVYETKYKNDYRGINEQARAVIDKIKTSDTSSIIHKVTMYDQDGFSDGVLYFSKLVAAEHAANNYINQSAV